MWRLTTLLLAPNTLGVAVLSSVCLQLRVVRAFKSTLEDLEEKRSIRSFHSVHSLRSSRSHQGHRPLSEELFGNPDIPNLTTSHVGGGGVTGGMGPKSRSPEQNGSYTNMALVIHENSAGRRRSGSSSAGGRSKSRSAENVSLIDGITVGSCGGHPTVVVQRSSPSTPRNYSSSSELQRLHETTI